jgi:transposase
MAHQLAERSVQMAHRSAVSVLRVAGDARCRERSDALRQFLEAGKAGLTAGRSDPPTREQQLEIEVADLTQAVGEAAVELRVWKKSAV